jgi:hypothetical protein
MVKPVPLIAADLTVTEPAPPAFRITPKLALEPTVTSPKLRLVGLTVRDGVLPAVPLRLIVGLLDALLLMFKVPAEEPATVGAYFTARVTVCFGLNVTGNVAPETVKPVPLIDAEFNVTAVVPLEESVTD